MKVMLAMLTIINIALTVFGVSMAAMSPMMFDSGGDGKLLWAIFWSLWVFPVVAVLCVFLPWLFLWLQWPRTALVASAVPITWMIILAVVLFVFFERIARIGALWSATRLLGEPQGETTA